MWHWNYKVSNLHFFHVWKITIIESCYPFYKHYDPICIDKILYCDSIYRFWKFWEIEYIQFMIIIYIINGSYNKRSFHVSNVFKNFIMLKNNMHIFMKTRFCLGDNFHITICGFAICNWLSIHCRTYFKQHFKIFFFVLFHWVKIIFWFHMSTKSKTHVTMKRNDGIPFQFFFWNRFRFLVYLMIKTWEYRFIIIFFFNARSTVVRNKSVRLEFFLLFITSSLS